MAYFAAWYVWYLAGACPSHSTCQIRLDFNFIFYTNLKRTSNARAEKIPDAHVCMTPVNYKTCFLSCASTSDASCAIARAPRCVRPSSSSRPRTDPDSPREQASFSHRTRSGNSAIRSLGHCSPRLVPTFTRCLCSLRSNSTLPRSQSH